MASRVAPVLRKESDPLKIQRWEFTLPDDQVRYGTVKADREPADDALGATATFIVAASDARKPLMAHYTCDGVADDVQIQAAIDALPSGGGRVMLSEGTFTLAAPIKLLSNVVLAGQGWATILIAIDGLDDALIRNSDWTLGGETNIIVRDLQIDSNGDNQADGSAIDLRNVKRSKILDCYIHDAYTTGIHWWTGLIAGASNDNNEVRGCVLDTNYDTSGNGMMTLGEWHDGVIADSQFLNAVDFGGMTVDQCEYIKVVGCVAEGNTRPGFIVEGTSPNPSASISYIGCVSRGNLGASGHGFTVIEDNGSVSYVGCHAIGNARHGFRLEGSDYCTIVGCVSRNNNQGASGGDGIILLDSAGGAQYNTIIGNVCVDDQGTATQGYGIRTTAAADHNLIQGNIVRDNVTAQILVAGSDDVVRDNKGYVTENSGTATINSGDTTVVITHGLAVTPTLDDITVTFGEQGTNDYGRWWISSITSTQFTINVSADPGASNLDLAWRAVVL